MSNGGISIPIQVDRSQLQAAIGELRDYRKLLGDIGNHKLSSLSGPTLDAGLETMNSQQGRDRPLPADLTRQFSGMDAATRRIASNLQTWETRAKKVREELKQINSDLTGISKASHDTTLRPSTRGVMLSEMQQLEAKKRELEREELRTAAKINSYRDRLPEGFNNQQPSPQNPQNQQEQRNWSGVKRLLGYGLAAAGGFGIGSFISQSRSDYRQAIDHEGPLFARGIYGSRDRAGAAAGIGMTPLEYYAMEEKLSASTGLSDRTGIGSHAMLTAIFAKSQGVSGDLAAGLRENIYQSTGNASTLPSAALLAIGRTTAAGLDKSKMTELLEQINRHMGVTASAMHGASMSKEALGASLALAVEGLKLNGERGVFAKSGEFANVMQNGLRGAGSTAGEIMLFKAMGGYDGPMDFEKIHSLNFMRQGGFMQRPDLLKKIMGGLTGSVESRAGQLESFFPQWNLGAKGSKTLVEMHQSGFFDHLSKSSKNMVGELEVQARGGSKQAAEWLNEIKSNPALSRQATEATKDAVRIEAGEKLSKLFEPLELSAAKMTEALASADWKKSFSILGDAAGQMGPAAKIIAGAAGLYAAGGVLSLVGGLGKGGPGMLSKLAPSLLNPVTGTAAVIAGTFGAIGWAGADNDKNLKRGQSDRELTERYHTLQVQGNPNGPEGQRIQSELKRRKAGGASAQPKPRGWYQHQDAIRYAAQVHNVPLPILAGLLESESDITNSPMRTERYANGKPFKVGGVAQFTDSTARARGIDPMNPASAIPGSAKYLRELYDQTGSWETAVAKYKGIRSEKNLWQRDTALFKAQKYTDEVDPQTAAEVRTLAPKSADAVSGGDQAFQQQLLQLVSALVGNTAPNNTPTAAPIPTGSR